MNDVNPFFNGAEIPEKAFTHEGCPRCFGSKVIPFYGSGKRHFRDCDYYGATYRVEDRRKALLGEELAKSPSVIEADGKEKAPAC